MERDFKLIARYHYKDDYVIAVTRENRPTATSRDYWLCKKHDNKRVFMFSAPYRDSAHEESLICKNLRKALLSFESNQEPVSLYV